jgi:uncharacterized protein YegL
MNCHPHRRRSTWWFEICLSAMRRLPVYLLVNTSGAMRGVCIDAMHRGLQSMVLRLQQDPQALEVVHLSVLTFDSEVRRALPLTSLWELKLPDLSLMGAGASNLGAALKFLWNTAGEEIVPRSETSKGDHPPLVFLLTHGDPSDFGRYQSTIKNVRAMNKACFVACLIGLKCDPNQYLEATNTVLQIESTEIELFFNFVGSAVNYRFNWDADRSADETGDFKDALLGKFSELRWCSAPRATTQ